MATRGRGGRRPYILVLLVLASVTLITLDQRQSDSGPIGTFGRVAHRVVAELPSVVGAPALHVARLYERAGVRRAGRDGDRAAYARDLLWFAGEAARGAVPDLT